MADNQSLRRYLERHAEPGIGHLAATLRSRHFKQVLVVPCFAEDDDFLEQMAIPGGSDTLIITVVNAPDNASTEDHQRTAELLQHLLETAEPNRLVIDRVSEPIAYRQGVGLARKIGADLAVALIAEGIVTQPWIYFSDADARLPADYFDTPLPAGGTVLFGFRHQAQTAELQRRVDLYELHLRYYTRQLRCGGSGYAFFTLGSLLSVSAQAYAAVRGVPKRNAAEDFYLLNKLAKVAPVAQCTRPVVTLAGRASTRVPFGTGPAISRIPEDSERYLSYAPAVFDALARALNALDNCAATGELTLGDPQALASLNTLGWPDVAQRLHNIRSLSQRRRQIREWFDAFRTMRFLRLAAATYPDQPLLATLRKLLSAKADAPAEVLLEALIVDEKPVTYSPGND